MASLLVYELAAPKKLDFENYHIPVVTRVPILIRGFMLPEDWKL